VALLAEAVPSSARLTPTVTLAGIAAMLALGAPLTLSVVRLVVDDPEKSTAVRLTTTLPAALGSRVAVGKVVPPTNVAIEEPSAIAHW